MPPSPSPPPSPPGVSLPPESTARVVTTTGRGVRARATGVRTATCVRACSDSTIRVDGGLLTMLVDDDNHGAVACEGVEGDGSRPRTSEVHLAITALGGDLDRGGMLCSVVADSLLYIGDGDVLTGAVECASEPS